MSNKLVKYDKASQKVSKKDLEKIRKETEQHFDLNAVLYFKPTEELLKLHDNERWFEGIVLLCEYFKRIGLIKLKEYVKSDDNFPISSKKIRK